MLHSPSSFVEWISRLVIGYYFKEHEPNSLPKLYLLYALMGALAADPLHLRGAPGVVESRPAYDGEVVVEVYLYLPLPLERLLYGVGDDGIVHDGRGADDRPLVHHSESLARALVHPHQDTFFRIDFYADGEVAKNGVCPQLLQVQYFLGFPQGAGRTPAASGQQHQEDGQDEDGAKHGGKEEGG